MKTLKFMFALALMLMLTQVSYGQITGTPHDFGDSLWNTYSYGGGRGTAQKCKICHTPHNASLVATEKPLWNHAVSATAAYVLYTNTTFNGSGTIGQPDGISKMCLGCKPPSAATNAAL